MNTIIVLASLAASTLAAADDKPNWNDVLRTVQAHFTTQKGYRTGDLISQSEVRPVFEKLKAIHFEVPQQEEILAAIPADQEFLVQQLQKRWGRPLMRKIAAKPLVYDQLDRIAQQAGGEQLIRDLPKMPDAPKAIRHLPDLLPKNSSGRTRVVPDYDRPTGRIYTETELLRRLDKCYRELK